MRKHDSLLLVLLLSVLSGHAQESFPRLGIGAPDIVLERATDLQVSLQESLRLFEHSIKNDSDPRAILCYTRTLLITLTAFRTNLMIRYADREHAPVQPKITEVEAQQLRSFIFQIMLLQAELLAFEETVLRRVSQQHKELAQDGTIKRWRDYIQRGRQRLAKRSELTGLAVTRLPTIRWEERHQLVQKLKKELKECDWKPVKDSAAEVELPSHLRRFAQAPLPWVREN